MILACAPSAAEIGVVRSLLATTECNVSTFSEAGYKALTGPQSIFPAALTALLTIYVAVLGYRLLLGVGNTRLADAPLIALKIGAILALCLNWNAFQILVYDLCAKAPLELAQIVVGPQSAPLDQVQKIYDQLGNGHIAFSNLAGATPDGTRAVEAALAKGFASARSVFLMSTAGIMSIALITTGVLMAIGPVFLLLFLFDATRGLAIGWIRALVASALIPMVGWMTIVLLLAAAEPALGELANQRQISSANIDAATTAIALIFVFAAAEAALVIGVVIIAASFNLRLRDETRAELGAERSALTGAEQGAASRAQTLVHSLERLSHWDSDAPSWSISLSAEAAAVPPQGTSSSSRPNRLGETYRRNSSLGLQGARTR